MMTIKRSERFRRNFKRRANKRIRRLFEQRLEVFCKNPYDPSLNTHPLRHNLEGYSSFSITDDQGNDDFRVIFLSRRGEYYFYDFGTHDQLYRSRD